MVPYCCICKNPDHDPDGSFFSYDGQQYCHPCLRELLDSLYQQINDLIEESKHG